MRPAVRAFFEAWAPRTLVLHGLSVRSVAHEVCQVTMMTGSATGRHPDLATRLADLGHGRSRCRTWSLAGPVYPGALAPLVARSGAAGQLQGLVDGSILNASDVPLAPLKNPTRDKVGDFVRRRTQACVAAFRDVAGRRSASALERASSASRSCVATCRSRWTGASMGRSTWPCRRWGAGSRSA